jgi:hypothetical protein
MLGRLEARGWRAPGQILACAAIRLIHNATTTAFFIWVIAGGLDAYAGTYDAIGRRFGIEVGTADALVLTLVSLLIWAAFASTVQVLVYRRGLEQWDELAAHAPEVMPDIQAKAQAHEQSAAPRERRGDPRLLTLIAVVTFGVLLATTEWVVLGGVAAALAVGAAVGRGEKGVWRTGLAFAAVLAAGAFAFGLGGGLGLDVAARRATRAALLVLTATWLRGAAGAEGLRDVSRRALSKLRRVPSADEAAEVLDSLESEGRLMSSGRALERQLQGVEKRPVPLLDAVVRWVVQEAQRRQAGARAETSRL